MKKSKHNHLGLSAYGTALSLILAAPASTQAVEFEGGILSGSIDTTVSFGTLSRVQGRDDSIVCAANGGSAYGCNTDDGNLNYDTGIVSQVAKIISDIELNHESGNAGAFFRVKAFTDTRNNDKSDTERTDLSGRAMDLVGEDLKMLDAYGWARFDLGGKPAEVRLGKHVLNWGESTFIGGGISAINPIDVAAMRSPGSEIREALLPVNMFSLSMDATDDLSVEGFYQLEWDRFDPDPSGSYFSTNDFATDGGDRLYLGWGRSGIGVSDPGDFLDMPRVNDDAPSDGGQWGIALRYFSEELNDTEFGLYYMNYHSRLPIISGQTGTDAGVAAGVGAIGGGASAAASSYLDGGGGYFVEYPEDIGLLGLSFNTNVGKWALQGEYSYKKDTPLQIDDIELVYAGLTPLGTGLSGGVGDGTNIFPNQLGGFGTDSYVQGYIERDVSQLQVTASRVFGNVMAANQFAFTAEAGITHVHNMPDKDVLRLDGPGTSASGNPLHEQSLANPTGSPIVESSDHFADATSWGYRLAGRWTYHNVFKGIRLLPRVSFQHDVNGVSPSPAGNFLEDRKAVTLGIGATYREDWSADLSYTTFFGAGRYNLLNDRDYVAFNLKYSF